MTFLQNLSAWRVAVAAAALLIGSTFSAVAQAPAAAPDRVIAKVNGIEIHESDLATAEEDIGQQLPADAPPAAKREYLITYLTDMILIAQDAEIQGMSGTDEFKRRFQIARLKVLMELELVQTARKAATDEAAMHKVYEEAIKQMSSQREEEVHARHILVTTEDEANAILAELKKGADFATLAKAKSIEPNAKETGGDLGYFTKDQMVPEFAEAAFKLKPGELSVPVQTQFGWHIIKVEDRRQQPIPTYEQVKSQLEGIVVRKARMDLVAKLRQQAKIERTDAPPAPPAPPQAPAPAPAPTPPTKK